MIQVENLTVRYGEHTALEGISFTLPHPSLLVVIGPNGAGKTTLLKALLGLVDYEGDVRIFGKRPEDAREGIGYMPQRDFVNTNIPLRVKDVVLMPLLARRIFGIEKEDVSSARAALEKVGMLDYWNRSFHNLSGGEQQRVLLARALARNTKILVLDEPFSATDMAAKMKMISMLHELKREKTIIIVTHDINPLVDCSDRFLLLNRRMVDFGDAFTVVTEENMERLYGVRVPVVRRGNACYVLGGDTHVHH